MGWGRCYRKNKNLQDQNISEELRVYRVYLTCLCEHEYVHKHTHMHTHIKIKVKSFGEGSQKK